MVEADKNVIVLSDDEDEDEDDEADEGRKQFQNVKGRYETVQIDTTTPAVSFKPLALILMTTSYVFPPFSKFQAAAEANATEIMGIPADQVAGRSTAAAKKAAEDAEQDLFERACLEPPVDEGPSDGQRALAATEYKGLKGMEILKINTRLTKQAAGQVMGFRQELSGFRKVQLMHSATLHEILDALANIKRQLATFEHQGILPGELAANPDLNPMLGSRKRAGFLHIPYTFLSFSATHLPFNTQQQVISFLDSWERTVALQKYVTRNTDFSQRGFVLAMIRLICTPEYRRRYSFPVGQLYENLVYIPARFVENGPVSYAFPLSFLLLLLQTQEVHCGDDPDRRRQG